jgi:hypothetical protein
MYLDRPICRDPEGFWEENFGTILTPVIQLLDHPSAHVRVESLRAVQHLLKTQIRHFGITSITAVLHKLLRMHTEQEQDDHVRRAADDTLLILSEAVSPRSAAPLLVPILTGEDRSASALLTSIKLVTMVLRRLPKIDLVELQSDAIAGLVQHYTHKLADVRKAVVFALVEIHHVLGDSMMQHLSMLGPSQMKLLRIYIQRTENRDHRSRDSSAELKRV